MKRSDAILGGIAVLLAVAVFLDTLTFPEMQDGSPGPALFPRIMSVLLALIGGIIIYKSTRPHEKRTLRYERAAVIKSGLMLVAIAGYILLAHRLGFMITAGLFMLGLMLMLGVRVRTALPTAVLVVLITFVVFEKVLRVPLPPGILGV
jgi:putative tricarboxylic transport membrane protein